MFDQPMEELDPTIVSLDAAGSGIEGEMTLPMTSMVQEEPSAPETNEHIQLHEENQTAFNVQNSPAKPVY